MNKTPYYDRKRERLEAESAKTLADLLIALRDACDELHALIAEPPADHASVAMDATLRALA